MRRSRFRHVSQWLPFANEAREALTIYTHLLWYPDFWMNDKILIAANESIQTRDLVQGLRGVSLYAHLLPDARSILSLLKDRSVALVVLDNALPDMSGVELCRIIKTESGTRSIFVLLLLNEVNDQLKAFEFGAADCIMKPFNIRKLVLQIRNLVRSIGDSVTAETLKVGDLFLDRARHEVRAANCPVQCTPKEFILLSVFMERSGRVQTREQLVNDLWEIDSEVGPRAIDRHVCCLRAKLGPIGRYIETIPSAGYRLVPPLPPIFYGQPEDERLDLALGPDSSQGRNPSYQPGRIVASSIQPEQHKTTALRHCSGALMGP
jgi:two-component system phosphate regulon response regulator PhoB